MPESTVTTEHVQAALNALWPQSPFTPAEVDELAAPFPAQVRRISEALAQAEEAAVFDFLNWLTAQNIELTRLTAVGYVLQPMGHLLERWKTERKEA